MTWNYRLLAFDDGDDKYFQIHSVYYKKDKPVLFSTTGAVVGGNSIDGIISEINRFKKALNEPILHSGDKFPQEFNYDEWIKTKKNETSTTK
jgi:hypothetical protein